MTADRPSPIRILSTDYDTFHGFDEAVSNAVGHFPVSALEYAMAIDDDTLDTDVDPRLRACFRALNWCIYRLEHADRRYMLDHVSRIWLANTPRDIPDLRSTLGGW